MAATLSLKSRAKPSTTRPSKRPRRSSTPSESDESDGSDKAGILAALEAHSRALLGLDQDTEGSAESSAMALKRAAEDLSSEEMDDEDSDGDLGEMEDDGWGAEDGMVSDSEDEFAAPFIAASGSQRVPEVIFDQGRQRTEEQSTKAERRAFLNGNSAKMMSLASTSTSNPSSSKRTSASRVDADDTANSALDKTLHSMLMTSLLPQHTLNAASRPVEKRDAIASRLNQLAGYTLPGENDDGARAAAKHRGHSAKIKTGIMKADERRKETARREAEMAGSWVRGKGGLGDLGKRGEGVGGLKRKDDRLAMGEIKRKKGMGKASQARDRGFGPAEGGRGGRFEGGVLKVSQREIGRVEREVSGRKGGGGGGKRGKGKGKGGKW